MKPKNPPISSISQCSCSPLVLGAGGSALGGLGDDERGSCCRSRDLSAAQASDVAAARPSRRGAGPGARARRPSPSRSPQPEAEAEARAAPAAEARAAARRAREIRRRAGSRAPGAPAARRGPRRAAAAPPSCARSRGPRSAPRARPRRPQRPTCCPRRPTSATVPNFVIQRFRIPIFLLPIYQAAGHRVRRALGGARRDQRDRDRLRPQPERLVRRRAGLDAVHAGDLEDVRDRRQPRRRARTRTTRSTRSSPPPST